MIVLVTCCAGHIGEHLCRRLCDEGHRVHATSPREQETRWHQADMADLAMARRIFATVQPDVVFHLAGEVGAGPDFPLVLPIFHSLVASRINVLVAAMEEDCQRIVLTGSLTESKPGERIAMPQSPYEAAKWSGAG
jgi:nucleoside-diphosphate-sugar epimerase